MKTFVINLDRAKDRRQHMDNILSPIDILDVEYIRAIDGKELNDEEAGQLFDTELSYKRYGRNLSFAEISCSLSHHKCYKEIVKRNLECALILEDDISIIGDINLLIDIEKLVLTPEPMVMFLSGDYWYYNRLSFNGRYDVVSVFDAIGAYAYVINKAAAQLLLNKNPRPSCVADHWALYRSQGIKMKAIYPYVIDANIEGLESTIEQRKFGEIRANMSVAMVLRAYWLGIRKRLLYLLGGYVSKKRKPLVKKKRCVCINQAPLNPRSKRLSYADTFMALPMHYEYWDMTRYFLQSPLNVESPISAPDYVREYSDLLEVKQARLRPDCPNSCFFIGVPERWENRKFFKLLKDFNCRVLRSDPCANTIALKKTGRDYVNLLLTPSKIFSFIKRKMLDAYFKYHRIQYSDVFSSSNLNFSTVRINHPDYDDYVRLKGSQEYELPSARYAVFYDSYFPLHPDFKLIHKMKVEADYEKYLASMNSFFKGIEEKYDVEVVIAAHPSSAYDSKDFKGRKIIKWHTCELTLGAQFVINQSSNSNSFAMLADKPIIFITSDEVEKCDYLSRYITALSSLLGKQKYNIDHCDVRDMAVEKVEEGLRKQYIYTYLTDPTTENLSNEEIYSSYVKRVMGL